MKVYLAGPIFGLDDAGCNDWRNYATEKLDCETLNPMDRDFRGVEDDDEIMRIIVEGDKLDILDADIVLVNYGDIPPGSAGTSMEILFSWEQHKRVILVTTQEKVSPWLTYHSNIIYSELDHAIEEITEIYNIDGVIVKYGSFLRTSSG